MFGRRRKMTTLLKGEFRVKLAETMKRLGENTSKCFLLVDATDMNYPIFYCNDAYCDLIGYSMKELIGLPVISLFKNTPEPKLKEMEENIITGKMAQLEISHHRNGNYEFQALIECFPLQNEEQQNEYIVLMVSEITHKKIAQLSNELERRMFHAIEKEKTLFEKLTLSCEYIDLAFSPDAFSTIVMKVESEFFITSAVPFEGSYTHLIPKGMARNYYSLLMKLDDSKVYMRHKGYALSTIHQQFAHENGLNSCWQIPIPNHTGEIIGLITIFYNVQRHQTEFYTRLITKVINLLSLAYTYETKQQEVYQLAYTDSYTGFSNRHDFFRNIKDEIDGTILIIEPSEYSKMVELFGHEVGEEILLQLGKRIEKAWCMNRVARFTSSTLAVFIDSSSQITENLSEELELLTKETFPLFGNNIYIMLKVGVASVNAEIKAEKASRYADSALSVAKLKSGIQIEYYNEKIKAYLKKELRILYELVDAIKNKEFQAYVQPKIELYRGRIYSVEALARWFSPKLGFVSPGDFIPIAERAGLIREIDLQIIDQILSWMQQRHYKGENNVPVAVNISPEHFYRQDFIDTLVRLVQKYYIDPKYIIIEITENISLVDTEFAQKIINQLRLKGFQTSVDDFGIGYSSLSYLQKLNFSELKIDQSFTAKINEAGTFAIVRSILQIAHHLEMVTVAEGVETEEQVKLLKEIGCTIGQGYYFYRPMSLQQLEEENVLK